MDLHQQFHSLEDLADGVVLYQILNDMCATQFIFLFI